MSRPLENGSTGRNGSGDEALTVSDNEELEMGVGNRYLRVFEFDSNGPPLISQNLSWKEMKNGAV